MRSGLMDVAYCVPDHLRIDFLHIDNAVQAHLRALDKMLEERPDERVSGQVFYITDGRPQSLSSFLSPLHRSLRGGRPISPLIRIPPAATVAFAKAYQASSGILSRIRRRGRDRAPPTMPFWGLTPMEAYKVSKKVVVLKKFGVGANIYSQLFLGKFFVAVVLFKKI